MNMEMPGSRLDAGEKLMYEKFALKNPGMTEDDFYELRQLARNAHSVGAKKFYGVAGVLMEEENIPKGDEMKETREDNKAGE